MKERISILPALPASKPSIPTPSNSTSKLIQNYPGIHLFFTSQARPDLAMKKKSIMGSIKAPMQRQQAVCSAPKSQKPIHTSAHPSTRSSWTRVSTNRFAYFCRIRSLVLWLPFFFILTRIGCSCSRIRDIGRQRLFTARGERPKILMTL